MPVTRLLYPLYQLGNPQLRIFRPNWFLTLVRPGKEQPPDTVQFRIPMEMTKYDVKNYLEKIYDVPVGAIRTRIQFGSNKKRNHLHQKVKQPDYKVAYVQLTTCVRLKLPAGGSGLVFASGRACSSNPDPRNSTARQNFYF
uniref:Large ribosomal subunit protein uL23m n=1 Tax=Gasterosteus aculeatus aculeatus TaxID=481459 RepID=A0AAQ4PSM9_GASAC